MTSKTTTEIYHEKVYKNRKAFINTCAKAISDLTGEYPEDILTCIHDRSDGRELGNILEKDGKFAFADESISIDFNIDSHVYVYVPEAEYYD